MRTTDEIVSKIKEVSASGHDWLGTEQTDLIVRLAFEDARQFLKEDAKADEWKQLPRAPEEIKKEMLAYMQFAWEKANDQRGISAGRSMNHYSAWVWLCGDDLGDLNNYDFYGKGNLVKICSHYGWDSSQWDDGQRTNGDD